MDPKTTNLLYKNVLKRNSTFISFVILGAVATEVFSGAFTDTFWRFMNRGKLWADFKRDVYPKIKAKKEGGDE
ncbi:hypothetical protein QOT17_007874 [Balamuthia mandrillaris]